ncbi:FKBP-type peptidyl-prolyl cis-trans isomerase [Streptomyces sp. NPDC060027]|uniref:FKBP-type peptidyl-prolyl cis-trans isomerase n=1 Tax=Streptomyces sp. NPDC060027 TaxID=3347040 RepID=UPI0036CFA027
MYIVRRMARRKQSRTQPVHNWTLQAVVSGLELASVRGGGRVPGRNRSTIRAAFSSVAVVSRREKATFEGSRNGHYRCGARGRLPGPLGSGMVIKGWEQGLSGKHVGDCVLLNIPAERCPGLRHRHPGRSVMSNDPRR